MNNKFNLVYVIPELISYEEILINNIITNPFLNFIISW